MATALDVCIRGAGIVGRTLALLLARERLRVGLVEQPAVAASGHSDVRAYALNPASRALLEMLRAWPDPAHATPVAAMYWANSSTSVEGASQARCSTVRPERNARRDGP